MLLMPLPQSEPPRSGERPLAAGEISRSIALGDRPVSYVLRRSRRHTIGLSIDQQGLRVGAPERVSLREVESLIRQHGEWIGRKLDEWQNRRLPERLQIVDGAQLPLLGHPLSIHLAVGANRIVWNLQASERALTLCLRSPVEAPRLLEKALRERARLLFSERIDHYLPQLGVARPPLSLSAARTRWGSYIAKGLHKDPWVDYITTLPEYNRLFSAQRLKEFKDQAKDLPNCDKVCATVARISGGGPMIAPLSYMQDFYDAAMKVYENRDKLKSYKG